MENTNFEKIKDNDKFRRDYAAMNLHEEVKKAFF